MDKWQILMPEATTNYVTNPSFENNVNGWLPAWEQFATFEDQEIVDADTGFDASAGGANIRINGVDPIRNTWDFQVDLGANGRYGEFTQPNGEKSTTFEFYFKDDLSSVAPGGIWQMARQLSSGGGARAWQLSYVRTGGGAYQLQIISINDAGAVAATSTVAITKNGVKKVRVEWSAASAVAANDGFCRLYVNDALEANQTGLDNDTHDATSFQLGSVTGVAGALAETMAFDNVRWANGVVSELYGSSLRRVRNRARFSRYSGEVITDGYRDNEGLCFRISSLGNEKIPIVGSAYVRGSGEIRLRLKDNLTGLQHASRKMALNDKYWKRISVLGRHDGSDDLRLYIETDGMQQTTFYVDGAMVENKEELTSYCDGGQTGCRWNGVSHASISERSADTAFGGKWTNLTDEEYNIYVTAFGGAGMPETNVNRQPLAQAPGSSFDNISIGERVITFMIHAVNDRGNRTPDRTLTRINDLRQTLIDYFKPDRVKESQPFMMRFLGNDIPLIMKGYYDGGLEYEGDMRNKYVNSVPLRMLCLEPMWEEDNQEVTLLATESSVPIEGTAARINGQWRELGQGITAPGSGAETAYIEQTPDGVVYAGGLFQQAFGVALRRIAVLSDDYATWTEVLTGLDDDVKVVRAHPNGKIYIGGYFLNDNDGNAYAMIVEYDPIADTFTALGAGGAGAGAGVEDIAILPNGHLIVVGSFTSMGGVPNTASIARWDLDGSWHSVGGGFATNTARPVRCVVAVSEDEIYLGGLFTNADTGVGDYLLQWDGADWAEWAVLNDRVIAMAQDPRTNRIYILGFFTTIDSADINRIAVWNGTAFSPLGDGVGAMTSNRGGNNKLAFDTDGSLYVSGSNFTEAGGLTMAGRSLAVWNGSGWHNLDVAFTEDGYALHVTEQGDILMGGLFDDAEPTAVAGLTNVPNVGTADAEPIIAIWGNGRIVWLENQTTDERVYLDYTLLDNEILELDFRTGEKTYISNYRGDVPEAVLSNSDDITLSAGKKDQPKNNLISCFITNEVEPVVQVRYIPKHWSFDAVVR